MRRLALAALLLAGGCDTAGPLGPPASGETGARGIVVRGPLSPVCMEGDACDDAPFAAGFTVRRGDRVVGTFRTGADGRFAVRLDAGTYAVVPGAEAPLLQPEAQSREVVVPPGAVADVRLSFDTGIR